MNPTLIVIEDFDFNQYPITRIYSLNGKTIIQIAEPLELKSRKELLDTIEDLEDKNKEWEREFKSAEKEIDSLEKLLWNAEEKILSLQKNL